MRLSSKTLVLWLAALAAWSAPALAAVSNADSELRWKCKRWNGESCSTTDFSSPIYRQILVMPTGYTLAEAPQFWNDFDTFIAQMSNAGTAWSTLKRDRLLYVGYFVDGGALNTSTAAFGGAVFPHPIRDYALNVSNEAVRSKVSQIQATEIPLLKPMGVQTILNDFTDGITANSAPPSFLGGSYGIAKMNRQDLQAGFAGAHELGHAALNFLDEYVEAGLENLNIRSIDVATPLLTFDDSWSSAVTSLPRPFAVYDYNLSEILAGNGNTNVSLTPLASRVSWPISDREVYEYEGGMLFGRGTWHDRGSNVMNDDHVMRAADDGFALAHSESQLRVVESAFGGVAGRANDRLRNAGPVSGRRFGPGSTPTVLLYDGDKRHQFHPTEHYVVQVGWWERSWSTCGSDRAPYPCYQLVWRVAEKAVLPTQKSVDLKASSLYGLANLIQATLCGVGVTEVSAEGAPPFQLCARPLSEVAPASLPTFQFATPYEEVEVPATQWHTTYWWRFATYNGTAYSGFTGWSSFHRSF
jgi:hypothetical protein